jgi:hypothetical protein
MPVDGDPDNHPKQPQVVSSGKENAAASVVAYIKSND